MSHLTPEQAAEIDRALETPETRASVSASYGLGDPALADLFVGRPGLSGIVVTEQTALTYAAVWRAVTLIAQTVAGLPLNVYRRVYSPDGRESREPVPNHVAEELLNVEAGPDLDGCTLREVMTMHALTWGHGEAEIHRRGDGVPLYLTLLMPWHVRPDRALDGRLFYHVTRPNGRVDQVVASNVLSIIGPSPDGVVGYSPIRLARESIGMGLAAERFGAAFYGNAARPAGVLETQKGLSEEAIKRLRNSFMERYASTANTGKPLVLEEGMTFKNMTIPPEEAQFLQSRQFQVAEIARWFGTPPHMLFDLTKATFSNIEEQGIDFLTYGLSPWNRRWERAARRRLLKYSERRDHYVEANADAIVRADINKRYAAYNIGRQGGWLTINDICRRENLPDIGPDGDKHLVPLNMQAVGGPPPAAPITDGGPRPVDPGEPTPLPLRNAVRAALAEAVGRTLRVQANAATRAAKKPGEFAAWLDEFPREHRRLAEDVVGTLAGVGVATLNLPCSKYQVVDQLAGDVVAESRRRLQAATAGVAAERLAAAVEAEIATWTPRAAAVVSPLFESPEA